MKHLFVFIVLFVSCHINGQIGFGVQTIIDADDNENKYLTKVFDIDNDDDLDFLVCTTGYVYLYKNIGGINDFASKETIVDLTSNENFIISIELADLDNDGDFDIVTTDTSSNLSWYENIDGGFEFGSQQLISNLGQTSLNNLVYLKDINNDGNIDVVWYVVGTKLSWFENIVGAFGAEQIITSISNYPFNTDYNNANSEPKPSIGIADVDGDGDLDIVAPHSNTISLHRNDGLGNFNEEVDVQNTFDYTQLLHFFDVDSDGDLDVFFLHEYYNPFEGPSMRPAWLENVNGQIVNGNVGYMDQINDYVFDYIREVFFYDLDSNGYEDFILSYSNYENIRWIKNNGQITLFSNPFANELYDNDTEPLSDVQDIDNDGYGDLVILNEDDLLVLKHQGDIISIDFDPVFVSEYKRFPFSSILVDMDGDGDNDIVSGHRYVSTYSYDTPFQSRLVWYENLDGVLDFGNQNKISEIQSDSSPNFKVADIDGDGDVDVMSNQSDCNCITWYENSDGAGKFNVKHNLGSFMSASLLNVDVDGDGDNDILAGRSNGITLFNNTDGQGNYVETTLFTSTSDIDVDSIVAADVGNDGDLDFFTSFKDSNNPNERLIYWFENLDGQGNFNNGNVIDSGIEDLVSIITEDIDGDGNVDLAIGYGGDGIYGGSGTNYHTISWYKNLNGLGVFILQQSLVENPAGGYVNDIPANITVFDVDNDGDLDFLASLYHPKGLVWYENSDAQGTFDTEPRETLPVYSFLEQSFFPIDMDGDTDTDVFTIYYGKIVWLKNQGLLLNNIQGSVILDNNEDGCDPTDIFGANIRVVSEGIDSDTFSTYTQWNGQFNLQSNEGVFVASLETNFPEYYSVVPESYTFNFSDLGNTQTADFCIEATQSIDDLNIMMLPTEHARPGFDSTYQLVYENAGTTQLDGSVNLVFDSNKLNFLNASDTVASQTTNALTFDFVGLNPFESRTITLTFNVLPPPTVNGDDILVFATEITSNGSDNALEDNVYELEQTVVNSFDPNDKLVLQGDTILDEETGNYLDYIVRFQNTGTASAVNIRIEDVLDDKLDWNTFRPIASSHNYEVQILNGNNVAFILNDIFLPDSTNDEPNSHGFIAYKIKPKQNVQVGDIISGVADIYFDFNPPITTNIVSTEVVDQLSVVDQENNNTKLFPNPVNNNLRITSLQIIDKFKVFDLNGRELQSIDVSTSDYTLDVSELNKGVYFLEIFSGNIKTTKKFVKN